MRHYMHMAWGLIALIALALASPTWAQHGNGKDRSFRGRAQVRIIVRDQDDQNDTRAFQQWYGSQLRGYGTVDPETGERLNDVLQMVVEVNNGYLLVANREDSKRTIIINERTKVIFEELSSSRAKPGVGLGRRPNDGAFAASRIRPGDLLIAQGYLTANGKFVGTRIRVVGQSWGYDRDDRDDRDGRHYGYRVWGDVRDVDRFTNRLQVRIGNDTHTVYLERGGEVQINGRRGDIDDLNRGDRIVIYYRERNTNRIGAYLIVRLDGNRAYPRDNEPYWSDPKYDDRDEGSGTAMDGNLDSISTGVLLNKITLRTRGGRTVTLYMSKNTDIVDYDGDRISIYNLREGELLRVYYTDVNGLLFATKIVAR